MRFSPALPFALGLAALALPAWAADSAASEAQFLGNARQLTFEGKRAGEAYFRPDGQQLTFQSEREADNPFYQIYLLDLESGDTKRLSPGYGKTTCSFFQPGTNRLLYASTQLDSEARAKQKAELEFRASGKQRRYAWDYDPTFDIFSLAADGTGLQQLTKEEGYDAEGAYSPDGQLIVFSSNRTGYPAGGLPHEKRSLLEKDPAYFGEIYTMKADGSDVRRLTEAPGYDGGPFFSPDGQRIIWRHFDESGMVAEVWTMKLDGSDKTKLTEFGCMSWAPYYHPSGQYVIFTANKLGFENFELFVVDVAGTKQPVRITYTDGFDGLPVFSPDGQKLCWTSNRTGDKSSQLFLADWNHEAALKALAAAPARSAQTSAPASVPAHEGTAAPAEPPAPGEEKPFAKEITAGDLERQVRWLADPARGGRGTGTPGAQQAAEWAAGYFKKLGLQGVAGSYFHEFSFNAGERLQPTGNALSFQAEAKNSGPLKVDADFRPLSFSQNGTAEGEVVFAGYGLAAPESKDNPRYSSYEGLDVKDKIVLILRYVPEGVDANRRAHLNRYAGLRYKAMMARERGAKAVLFVSGPNSPQAGELLPLKGDNTVADSGIIAASITGAVAEKLLASSGKSLKDLQTGLDDENPHAPGGFTLPKVKVSVGAAIEHLRKTDRNVVAMLPPVGYPAGQEEYVLVGAHYDHLGIGKESSSMARSGEEDKIYPGADDNGSGTAAVLELAGALAAEPAPAGGKRRGVIFALWSGEEIGIIGSAGFAEKPPVPLDKITAYLNFDMVGRLRENKLTLQAVGSSKTWRKLIEKRNVAAGFQLTLQDDPYLPTDVTSFYPKKVPVLNFFTGAHEDYHRPTDTAEKLNYPGLERITKFARALLVDVASAAERPDFARVERTQEAGSGSRETLRAYLGTIPDYTQDVKGVKLSGVRGGSPAEQAGIQSGDVIVEFAGQKIANIYDYTYALDAVKVGKAVKIVVERGGKRVEVTAIPAARK